MTKTIRIIDLLDLIANEKWDKLPKKIKYNCSTYELKDNKYLTKDERLLNILPFSGILNNEVEIIEEQPKTIEKIYPIDVTVLEYKYNLTKMEYELNDEIRKTQEILNNSIVSLNELIDKVSEKE